MNSFLVLSTGLWAWPLPMNHDGDLDIVLNPIWGKVSGSAPTAVHQARPDLRRLGRGRLAGRSSQTRVDLVDPGPP